MLLAETMNTARPRPLAGYFALGRLLERLAPLTDLLLRLAVFRIFSGPVPGQARRLVEHPVAVRERVQRAIATAYLGGGAGDQRRAGRVAAGADRFADPTGGPAATGNRAGDPPYWARPIQPIISSNTTCGWCCC